MVKFLSFKGVSDNASFKIKSAASNKPNLFSFVSMVVFLIFVSFNIDAQTTIISPAGDGGFNNGSTFAANGWTVANQGVNPSKWVVGTGVSATTTATVATVTSGTNLLTLTAGNPLIYPGMKVTASSGVLAANTYVSSISGTALTLTNNTIAAGSSVTLTFGFGSNAGAVGSSASVATVGSATITLTVANPGVVVGQSVTVTSGTAVLAPNTYVTNVNGATITLSQPTIATSGTAVTYSFGATSSAISGNAAYVSSDGGATNTPYGYAGNRTLYFYRDVTVSAEEQAMTLSFDVKSPIASTSGWQVWVAPTSQTVIGTDTQVTSAFLNTATWAGATLVAFNHTSQVGTTKQTAFIPKSFAGTTFRLIFVWTNGSSALTLPSAAIDNISLVSRAASEINSIGTGLWSNASIWDIAVPTPADTVIVNASNVVSIDCKYSGASDLFVAGTNATLQWANSGTVLDEFKISNDLGISGSGARFNVYEAGVTTNGKKIFLAHDLNVTSGGRFDTSATSFTSNTGYLNLNGSTVQTVTVDGTSFVGGTNATTSNSTNTQNVIGQLAINNTCSTTPNIIWNANNVKIGTKLFNNTGRIALGTNKITIGNYGSVTETPSAGTGFIGGTVSKWISSAYTTTVPAGVDYPFGLTNSYGIIYQLLDSKGNSRWTLVYPDANPATAGEVAVTYTNASSITTGLSLTDGGYTINNRYDGNWMVTVPNSNTSGAGNAITFTPNATTNTFRIGTYATGGYVAKDGSSRLMNASAALGGVHQDGTNTPFAFRSGVVFSALTAAPLYLGTAVTSMVDASAAVTSATTGEWTNGSTWVGGVVPSACQTVIIASGHSVTVSGTAVAGNVLINNGATLVNASGSLTVGCSGNNASLENYGTYTCNGGTVNVNGYVAHRANSYFNHTGGDIIVDGNDDGNVPTSVGFGGTIFKIETSNLNLTGGKITIVDPLVNYSTPFTASSSGIVSTTQGATGTFSGAISSTPVTSGATTIGMGANGAGTNFYAAGMYVSGTGIAAGTTISSVAVAALGGAITITLSAPTTAAIAASSVLQFSSMANGSNKITLAINAANAGLAAGYGVSGPGIPSGTVVVTASADNFISLASGLVSVTLSNAVTGLSPNPVTGPQTITFSTVTPGSYATVLNAANPNIIPGMIVAGAGLLDGTYVTDINGTAIKFSQPIQAGAPATLSLNFYSKNFEGSGAFVYDSANHYAAGLGHTLQIGDGISTQKGSLITNGFNCVFQKYNLNGMLSLGNLIVNAPDGTNRFMNSMTGLGNNGSCNLNVQGDFTITEGSVFKKQGANSSVYVGGSLVNNGSFLTSAQGITLVMGNFINGFCVPSTVAQSISGSGTFSNNLYSLSTGYPGSIPSLNINNTSTSGVTLNVANFRTQGATLTNGILHTSAAYPLLVGDFTGGGLINTSTSTTPGGSGVPLAGISRYVEGPLQVIIPTTATATQLKAFPLGKNGKFLPLQISGVGGVELLAEAFDTNTGTTTANASLLSSNRWKVSRVGTTGAFTSFNVQLGSTDVKASNILVQASTDQGAYDTFAGNATVYTGAMGFGLPYDTPTKTNIPVLQLTTPPTSGFTGYFSYAQGPACSGTPTPGNTVASLSSVCGGAPTTLSLQNATAGTAVTYQWQVSTNGGTTFTNILGATSATYVAYPTANSSYLCNVSCAAGSPVASNPVAITVSSVGSPTVTGATVCIEGTANLSASGAGILSWYAAPTGGTALTTGTTYAPSVNATTTYYVSSTSVVSASAGQTNPSTSTTTATANFRGLSFDATRAFKLKTVTVYPKNTAAGLTPIIIRLYDASGNVVSGTSDVTFTPTLVTGTANSVAQTVTLNYNVPVGTGYRLVAAYGMAAANALGTNTVTAQTFPAAYSSFTITGNVSDLSTAPATTANTYNCFFNIQIDENCESARVPVTATVNPLVTYYADADGDGYGNTAVSQQACTPPLGYVTNNTDCDDSNNANWQNGDFYVDADGDGYTVGSLVSLCYGASTPSGYAVTSLGSDCDDTNNAKWQTGDFYVDADADGYTVGSLVSLCYGASTPAGYTVSSLGSDCDDANSAVTNATVIVTEPTNPTICKLANATATVSVVAATTSNATYQWFTQAATGSTSWTALANNANYSGVTSATLTITRTTTSLPVNGTKYRVVITGGGQCGTATSATVTLQEQTVLSLAKAITAKSSNNAVLAPALTACEGSTLNLSLATGSIGNIQWMISTNSGSTWTSFASNAQTTLSVANGILTATSPALAAGSAWFKVVATNGACSSSESALLKITVSAQPIAGSISGGGITVCAPLATGFDASGSALTAAITNSTVLTLEGATNATSIVWQKSVNYTSATPTWSAISGATTSSYTATALATATWFRALVTNGACSAYSNVVKISVSPSAKAGVITSAASVCSGGDITFSSAAYTGTSIKWQVSTTSATTGFSDISGATSTTYTMTGVTYAPLSKFYVRSVVTSGSCTSAFSAAKTITVNPLSVAGTVKGGGTICSGSNGTLSVAGNTGTIQWQSSENGTDFVNVPSIVGTVGVNYASGSATGIAATYIASNITANTYFRAKITSGACSVAYSNAVQFTIATEAVSGTLASANETVCSGTGTTLTLAGSVGTIKWYKSTNWTIASPTWTAITTSTNRTLATGNLTASTAYKAEVTIGSCSTVSSQVVPVLVYAAPLAKTITANVTSPSGATSTLAICASTSKVLTIGSGSNGAIQWQKSTTSTTTGFADIAEATGTSYTVTNPAIGANYFRAKFTNSCGVSVFGLAITVYYKECASTKGIETAVTGTTPFSVVSYPNPFTNNFNINVTSTSSENVEMRVYDMIGKLIETRQFSTTEMDNQEVGSSYPAGIYNVIVTQGEEMKTLRVIKK